MANDRQQSMRRLAAVMVADVVGYSRLMEADEAGTLAALRVRRKEILDPVVKARGGRVVKLMGDGVLVEFASAVAAVEAALALQEGFARTDAETPEDRRIRLRIGINLGEVTGEGGDIFGDGVNVAARLEALAEPGGIAISAKVMDEIRGRLPVTAADMGEQSLKNISRPVRVYRVEPGQAPPLLKTSTHPSHHTVSVAVLPFANLSGDPAQDQFVDGLTEDLITALSKSPHLAVVARNSVFQFRNRHVDVQVVGRQLGARFVLEGSARSGAGRVRVTAQLIDSATGMHLWAERYDQEQGDIFALQDGLVASIAGRLHQALIDAAAVSLSAVPESRLSAQDHFIIGRSAWGRGAASETLAHDLASVQKDPTYAPSLAGLAFLYSEDMLMQHVTGLPLDELADLSLSYAERATAFGQHHAAVQLLLGSAMINLGELERARRHLERVLALDPYYPNSRAVLGLTVSALGDHREGEELKASAIRLEPRLPPAIQAILVNAACLRGDADAAVAGLEEIQAPEAYLHLLVAGCLAHAGRMEQALQELAMFHANRAANYDLEGFVRWYQKQMALTEDRERFLKGMRALGVIP